MATASANKIMMAVIGAIVIFYLVANTWDDAGESIDAVNEDVKGGKIVKLLPLFLALGLLIAMINMLVKKNN